MKAVTQFACQGNEPFWNLIVDGNTARFASLSGAARRSPSH